MIAGVRTCDLHQGQVRKPGFADIWGRGAHGRLHSLARGCGSPSSASPPIPRQPIADAAALPGAVLQPIVVERKKIEAKDQ